MTLPMTRSTQDEQIALVMVVTWLLLLFASFVSGMVPPSGGPGVRGDVLEMLGGAVESVWKTIVTVVD